MVATAPKINTRSETSQGMDTLKLTLVSSDVSKFVLVTSALAPLSSDPEKMIQKIDNQALLKSPSDSSLAKVLNEVSKDTYLLVIDLDTEKEIPISLVIDIVKYVENVYSNLYVVIVFGSTIISQEFQAKIVELNLSKNFYNFLDHYINPSHLFFLILNYLKQKKQVIELENKIGSLDGQLHKLYKYFSEDVVQEILLNKGKSELSASKEATILFLDIRSFTSISEKLSPEQVVELLDLLFTDIVDLIFSYKGSVNKFIGDAILATFGCPKSYGNDAENAVKCAINLISALSLFNQVKPAFLADDINIGIGIATGVVFAGNVGSYRKMEYTVIGDTVNLASRLQDMTKKLSCKLVLDLATYSKQPPHIKFKKTDIHSIRGKKNKVDIFYLDDESFDD